MVFSSIQAYLDSSNWQQQLNCQIGIGGTTSGNTQIPPASQPPPLQPPPPHGMGGPGGPGSIRPGSMADRARMANIPMPETALKCPRCESTNTKFCYFNNYSLTQPRHFCKTCRRYWTRGGALRNVPVGGGCRRNKRSKGSGSSSKSPVSSGADRQNSSGSSSSLSLTSTSVNPGGSILGMTPQLQLPPLRFMAPLNQLTEFSPGEIGLNYGGMSAPSVVTSDQMNFNMMSSQLGGGYMAEQWRLQAAQISSLAGLDLASNSYPFQGINLEAANYVNEGGLIRPKNMISSSGLSTQMASVKMEENNPNNNNQELNLSRQFLGMQGNDHHQYWGTNSNSAGWTDLSGFSSSSTSNPL